jgi:hypothetical protein
VDIIGIEKKGLKDLYIAVERAEAKGKSVIKTGYETLGNIATVWAILDDGATVEGQIRFRFDEDSAATEQFIQMILCWLERCLG